MKDPHNRSEYDTVPDTPEERPSTSDDNGTPTKPARKNKKSGAYYYVETDEKTLAERSFIRTVLTVIALMLQVSVLCLPQEGLAFVTERYPSYAFAYMFAVFVFIGISVGVLILIFTRYKFVKRIPVEYAPKHGFKRRAFFGAELYIAANAVIAGMELSFVCFEYDGYGLAGVLLAFFALAAAVCARQVTHATLKSAALVPATQESENNADKQ